MAIRTQLSVTMENRPGTLARMASALAEKKVNILALASMERGGQSLARIVVDKLAAAKKALSAIGYAYTEEQVLATKLPNRPGTLAAVAQKLGDAGVNIDYAYYGAEVGSAQVLLLLAVSDFETGKKVVR
jgi:hypothetical protein